ncbi:MAG: AbrB/MazE/SpoVT family DNA-binding domain-containing protein [Pseudomonadota bacterium]
MELVRVKRNFQITIPQSLRRKVKLEVGDYVQVESEKGRIIIRPVKVVQRDHEYFHTEEWQAKEAEADREIAQGDLIGPVTTAQGALKALKNTRK